MGASALGKPTSAANKYPRRQRAGQTRNPIMQQYKWKGVHRQGKIEKGFISARSKKHLTQKLLQKNIALLSCSQKSHKKKALSTKELEQFFDNLSNLIECSIPIISCLNIMKQNITILLKQKIKDGVSLSDAMDLTKQFPPHVVHIVRAGEQAGTLTTTTKNLAIHLEKQNSFKKKLQHAAIMPTITIIIAIGITISIFTLVIPQFIPLFIATKQNIPNSTKIMISISEFLITHLTALPLIFILTFIFARALCKRYAIYLPYVGKIIVLRNYFLFTQSLSLLIKSGIPLRPALRLARQTIQHQKLKNEFIQVEKDISNGASLTKAITYTTHTPPELHTCIHIGEQTGKLGEMLEKSTSLIEKKIDTQLKILTTIFQPLLILIIGLFVAAIIYAIYLPLTSIPVLIA
jgi:type II secretory pathway component PulF